MKHRLGNPFDWRCRRATIGCPEVDDEHLAGPLPAGGFGRGVASARKTHACNREVSGLCWACLFLMVVFINWEAKMNTHTWEYLGPSKRHLTVESRAVSLMGFHGFPRSSGRLSWAQPCQGRPGGCRVFTVPLLDHSEKRSPVGCSPRKVEPLVYLGEREPLLSFFLWHRGILR